MRAKIVKKDLLSVDLIRGIAALSVFIYHYGVGHVLAKITGWSGFNILSIPGATYAVPLFFAVSGFCIHLSQLNQEKTRGVIELDYKTYAWRRFWRIYPAYLLALLFSCMVQAMSGEKVEVGDLLIHLLLMQGFSVQAFNSLNLVLWTISIEVMFYTLYPLWHKLRVIYGLNRAVLIGFAISLISWGVCVLWLFPYSLPERWFVLNLWGAWLTGAWLAEKMECDRELFRQFKWWITGLCAIAATSICVKLGFFAGRGAIMWDSCIIVLCLWPFSALLLANNWLINLSQRKYGVVLKFLRIIGRFSYSLYLLHMPLMYLRNIIWAEYTSGLRLLSWGLGLFTILGISYLSYQLFEKPFIAYRLEANIIKPMLGKTPH